MRFRRWLAVAAVAGGLFLPRGAEANGVSYVFWEVRGVAIHVNGVPVVMGQKYTDNDTLSIIGEGSFIFQRVDTGFVGGSRRFSVRYASGESTGIAEEFVTVGPQWERYFAARL